MTDAAPSLFAGDVPSGQTPELLDHQVEGIKWLAKCDRALLADEPGLGKTCQLLQAARAPVLVVAPAMVLDSGTWDDEIALWAPDLDVTQVPYTSLLVRREKGRVMRDGNNYPIVDLRPDYQRHWGTVIADESHYLKGRKTSWTAGFFQLSCDRMHLATGTPIPNWAHEAFTALQLMYPEEAKPKRRFGSYWRWAKEWFAVGPTRWSPMDVGDLREDRTWDEFYRENWGDRMLLRRRKDCLDLPPLTHTQWRVKMTPAQRKAYRELKRDFVTWLESGAEIAAWSSAGQLVKLMKCATGLEVLNPGASGSGKLDALRTILRDRPLPTLVVAHFRDSVAACARVAEEVGANVKVVDGGVGRPARREAIREFQSGGLQVLCATLDTIAEGMTLHQGGADQVIFVERSARPSRNEQALRRLHRMGLERPVSAIDLITEDTADERILELLAHKTDQTMRALGLAELRSLAE